MEIYGPVYAWVAKRCESPVVELGCGLGMLLSFLGPKCEYTGIDISTYALEKAEKFWGREAFTRFYAWDLEQGMPIFFSPDSHQFRTVVAIEVLEHLESDASLVAALKHVRFVGSVPAHKTVGSDHYRTYDRKVLETRYPNVVWEEVEEGYPYVLFSGRT
jgi:2-polyprenyl-3-methyl-5-hydroxy-6-metoxy-1,4-benzoquinol methylase